MADALPSHKWLGYFQNGAVKQLNGRANKVQIGDKGIDGRIYPVGVTPRETGAGGAGRILVSHPSEAKGQGRPAGH